jgi:amino acid transporter
VPAAAKVLAPFTLESFFEETKNPARDIPIGIIGSLAICTILYIVVVATLTGIVPHRLPNMPSPVACATDYLSLSASRPRDEAPSGALIRK